MSGEVPFEPTNQEKNTETKLTEPIQPVNEQKLAQEKSSEEKKNREFEAKQKIDDERIAELRRFLGSAAPEDSRETTESLDYQSKFQEPVGQLLQRITENQDPRSLPEYLGRGSNADVYRISSEGKDFAVKLLRRGEVKDAIKPMQMSVGIDHTAKLVAFSEQDNAVVMELIAGKPVTELTPETSPDYKDEEIVELINTIIQLNERGLVMDPKLSNTMYSPETGFTLLDYHVRTHGDPTNLTQEMFMLSGVVGSGKYTRLTKEQRTNPQLVQQDDINYAVRGYKSSLRTIAILDKYFPDLSEKYRSKLVINDTKDPPLHRQSDKFQHVSQNSEVLRLEKEFRSVLGLD